MVKILLPLPSLMMKVVQCHDNCHNSTLINYLYVELTVEFNQTTYNGREDSERILVTLNLLGGTAMNDFSVNISTSPIFATGKHNLLTS